MKWFKKISDLFKVTHISSEQWMTMFGDLYTSKLNYETYKALMYANEIFHFNGKDWIIYNVSTEHKKIELHDSTLHFNPTKLKLRSIEDDPRMTIKLDLSAHQFENIIDVDKYFQLVPCCRNFRELSEDDIQKVKEILNKDKED